MKKPKKWRNMDKNEWSLYILMFSLIWVIILGYINSNIFYIFVWLFLVLFPKIWKPIYNIQLRYKK